MIAFLSSPEFWFASPLGFAFGVFAIWMFVDAVRRDEWLWAMFIFLFPPINAPLYFFLIYRNAPSVATLGFEMPGARDRRRIKELEARIHHLDKAHHHLELGDIYFQQGKLPKALTSYQSALERDPNDIDTRSHLGQCLLRLNRSQEAREMLAKVCAENPNHDYGYSMMALAEAQVALQETDAAIATLRRVLESHSYARARVQLAALYFEKGESDLARAELKEVLADDAAAPDFQRRRERVWIRRAKRLLKQSNRA